MRAARVASSASCRCVTNLEIGAADLELRLHDLERALTVGERLREDLLALARGDFRGQRILDLTEGPEADRCVRGDGLFLLRRPNLDLPLEGAAPEDGREQVGADVPDGVVAILQHEQFARDRC